MIHNIIQQLLFTFAAMPQCLGSTIFWWYFYTCIWVIPFFAWGAFNPGWVRQFRHAADTVYWYFIDRFHFKLCAPSLLYWEHRHLLALEALEEMSPHLLLDKKEVPWLLSKYQCNGKCNGEEATVIPPRLHLSIHKKDIDGWFLSSEEICNFWFSHHRYTHVHTVKCLHLQASFQLWILSPMSMPCVQNLSKLFTLHIKVHR